MPEHYDLTPRGPLEEPEAKRPRSQPARSWLESAMLRSVPSKGQPPATPSPTSSAPPRSSSRPRVSALPGTGRDGYKEALRILGIEGGESVNAGEAGTAPATVGSDFAAAALADAATLKFLNQENYNYDASATEAPSASTALPLRPAAPSNAGSDSSSFAGVTKGRNLTSNPASESSVPSSAPLQRAPTGQRPTTSPVLGATASVTNTVSSIETMHIRCGGCFAPTDAECANCFAAVCRQCRERCPQCPLFLCVDCAPSAVHRCLGATASMAHQNCEILQQQLLEERQRCLANLEWGEDSQSLVLIPNQEVEEARAQRHESGIELQARDHAIAQAQEAGCGPKHCCSSDTASC